MAESDVAKVDYCSVLNVRKEVKIVFQGERKSEIFYQSCKVHFFAFQTNENDLRAAYKRMSMLYRPDKHQEPAKKRVRLKTLSPCSHQAKLHTSTHEIQNILVL